jgi:hypothetical protein
MKGYSPDGITGKALLSNWRGFFGAYQFLAISPTGGYAAQEKDGHTLNFVLFIFFRRDLIR